LLGLAALFTITEYPHPSSPLQAKFAKHFAQHRQRPDPLVLNVFQERTSFAFNLLADELRNPGTYKNRKAGLQHLCAPCQYALRNCVAALMQLAF
jgi:hypothetical protein